MQEKLKFSLGFFLVILLIGSRANAQGEGQNSEFQELNQQHPELNLNDDKTLLMDGEVKPAKAQSNSHEASNPAAQTPSNANAKNKSDGSTKPSSTEKAEEDPLSFNFLYFIIQKFKISDIVDD
jgi:hypothetical protein